MCGGSIFRLKAGRIRWMVPRARIGLATPAFSGPRSTNELPRHGSNLRFYGKEVALKRENGLHCWPSGRFAAGHSDLLFEILQQKTEQCTCGCQMKQDMRGIGDHAVAPRKK